MSIIDPSMGKSKMGSNPNGMSWANDTSTFGHKMLAGMGWSKGEGLGKSKEGRVDNIKVQKKDNMHGIGKVHNPTDNWLKHNEAYSHMLSSLNAEFTATDSVENGVVKNVSKKRRSSKKDKKALGRESMYRKRVQHKCVRNYSSEDLQQILGHATSVTTDETDVFASVSQATSNGTAIATRHEVTQSMYVEDYFQSKLRQKQQANHTEVVEEVTVESVVITAASTEVSVTPTDAEDDVARQERKKAKKEKRKRNEKREQKEKRRKRE